MLKGLRMKAQGGYAHLGYFLPIYLSPILYDGSQESKYLYFVLLLLFLWAFNSIPKPITAFLPVVNYPLIGAMTPNQVAAHYLSVEVLSTTAVLLLVSAVDSATTIVPRIGLKLCSHYGLRRAKPFLILCLFTFLAAMFCSTTTLAAPLLYFIDRVLQFLHNEHLDTTSEHSARYRSQDNTNASTGKDADDLFDKLAEAVIRMRSARPSPRRQRGRRGRAGHTDYTDAKEILSDSCASPDHRTPLKRRHSLASTREFSSMIIGDEATSPADVRRTERRMERRPSILKSTPSSAKASRRSSVVDFAPVEKSAKTETNQNKKSPEGTRKAVVQHESLLSDSPKAPSPEPMRSVDLRPRGSRASVQTLSGSLNTTFYTVRGSRGTLVEEIEGYGFVRRHSLAGTRRASMGRASSVSQITALNEMEKATKARERRRLDMRSAFLIAPAIVCMLGSLSSLATIPGKEAIVALLQHVQEVRRNRTLAIKMDIVEINLWTWTAIVLPACLVVFAFCCLYFYMTNLRPYELGEADQQETVTASAKTRLRAMGPLSGLDYLFLYCLGIYVACTAVVMFSGLERLLPQVSLLSITLVVVSFKVPWSRTELVTVELVKSKLPWGALLMLGASHAVTQLVLKKDLVGYTMRYIHINKYFWTHQPPIVSQTVLATFASLMAESTNNAVLTGVLMDVIKGVAMDTNRYVVYYAIPVAIGACTNTILPMSVPLVFLHDCTDVTLLQLLVIGVAVKALLIALVMLSVNTTGRVLLNVADPIVPYHRPVIFNATNLTITGEEVP
ncbi:uncharacterized protein LOC135386161 isoform X2 [Ornithodoros turicata]